MTHNEWSKEVKKALIDRDMNAVALAVELHRSAEWVYSAISTNRENKSKNEKAIAEISEYLDIPNYMA